MPDMLALEWEQAAICGMYAQVTPGRVAVKRRFRLRPPDAAVMDDPQKAGAWLRDQLTQFGDRADAVLVSLPREAAVVKRLELPDVSDAELPVLVRFQAGAKSSQSLDEMGLDFLPLPRRADVPGREALLATVPRQRIDLIRAILQAAGQELTSLGLTPVAVVELVARAEPLAPPDDVQAASLVVSWEEDRVEISVLRRQHLLFSHALRLEHDDAGDEQQIIVAEISRALVALRGQNADLRIDRGWLLVAPQHQQPLAEALARRLACPVEPLDPFAAVDLDVGPPPAPGESIAFAGPIGMLLSRSGARAPTLDFLAPRQPPVVRDERRARRKLALLAGAALAVVLFLAYGYELYALSATVGERRAANQKLESLIKRGDPVFNAAAMVRDWSDSKLVWLDELRDLTIRMPATDRMYLTTLRMEPQATGAAGKMKLIGFARERSDVISLTPRWASDQKRFKVLPHNETPATQDELYPLRFDTDVLIMTAPEPKPAEKQPPPAASSPPAAGGASTDTPAAGASPPHVGGRAGTAQTGGPSQ